MGFVDWLNKVTGGDANGTRKAMRASYTQHVKAMESGRLSLPEGTTPHQAGLYGALGTRYMTFGLAPESMHAKEPQLWMELIPFMHLEPSLAVEALAEYVVLKEPETHAEARLDWLVEQIQEGVAKAELDLGADVWEQAGQAGIRWGIFRP